MSDNAFDRLSFLDTSCLVLESENLPMHVASLARYEAGSLATPEAGIDVDRNRAYVASRLHRVPRYRQRLAWTPIERHPVWMDDHRFDLEYHVCHAALPKPGDERQLKALVARLMAEHLDRERPLWGMRIVEALDAGRRFAVLTKLHHCMVDGISAVDMLTALMRPEPRVEIDPAPAWTPRPAPNRWQLGGESLARWARLPIDAAKEVPGLLASLHDPRSEVRTRIRVVRDTLAGAFRSYSPSPTPFNGPVGRHRRVDWAEMDLAALRAVKGAAGGTLNDVVLAVVTGAVRRFLERRGANVAGLDFRVLAPVSLRAADERGRLGNRVSAWLVPLPLEERNALRALARIRETTECLKATKQALAAETLLRAGEWIPTALLDVAASGASRRMPFQIVVTNVPGPETALHLLDARMIDNCGMVPLGDDMGLGIVLLSYLGKLSWGFTADRQQLPDLADFVRDVQASFAELHRAAVGTVAAAA